jgi:hypothetical protein
MPKELDVKVRNRKTGKADNTKTGRLRAQNTLSRITEKVFKGDKEGVKRISSRTKSGLIFRSDRQTGKIMQGRAKKKTPTW